MRKGKFPEANMIPSRGPVLGLLLLQVLAGTPLIVRGVLPTSDTIRGTSARARCRPGLPVGTKG